MPQPLLPLTLQAPGNKGLNSQRSSTTLDTNFATELQNAVFDLQGRVTSRKGWSKLTTSGTPGAYEIATVFCYETASATSIISTANNKIFSGTTTLTDRTGTITAPSADNWQFAVINNTKIVGVQASHPPILATGIANFADLAGTNIPTTPTCICSAFGRAWVAGSDGTTVYYSKLLDPTDWSTASGGGSISTSTYWPGGNDFITAITSYEDKLVIFGQKNILIYDSPDVVANILLNDIVAGVGCIARDSVAHVGKDLIFLSETGLRSFRRSLITGKAPLGDISDAVRDYMMLYVTAGTASKINGVYNALEGIYVLTIPYSTYSKMFCFDVKEIPDQAVINDDALRISEWVGYNATALAYGRDKVMYGGFTDTLDSSNRVVGYYTGYTDNTVQYTLKYKSTWMDLANEQMSGTFEKILKKASVTTSGGSTYQVTLTWGFDFTDKEQSSTYVVPSQGTLSEWNSAEYGIGEYNATNRAIFISKHNMSRSGHTLRVGIQIPIIGYEVALQTIDIFLKRGRMSR
jgi:hypothetical protein